MLTLSTPVFFGRNDRFKAYGYYNARYSASLGRDASHTIFVQDNEQIDKRTGLPLIIFQEWSERIDSLDQVIDIVRKRFPDAFDVQERYNALFFSPTGK